MAPSGRYGNFSSNRKSTAIKKFPDVVLGPKSQGPGDHRKRETEDRRQLPTNEFSFPRLVVFCPLSFTPTKRYEEVDGVRKEKERLTTDHQPQR